MSSFITKILKGIVAVSGYLTVAVQIVEVFLMISPKIVKWVYDKMEFMQPKIDAGDITGDEAREAIVEEGSLVLVGSGAVIGKGDLRTLVDQLHKIRKAGRIRKDPYVDREVLAVKKGYIKSKDLERAKKAMPYFQPLD